MKIFIVEDDRGLRKQLKTFLEKYGYSCLYSDDFQNIEERISESNADMVLLDVNLPYKDLISVVFATMFLGQNLPSPKQAAKLVGSQLALGTEIGRAHV